MKIEIKMTRDDNEILINNHFTALAIFNSSILLLTILAIQAN